MGRPGGRGEPAAERGAQPGLPTSCDPSQGALLRPVMPPLTCRAGTLSPVCMPQRRVAPYIAGGFCYSSPRQLRRGAGGLIPHGQGRGSEGSGPFPCPSPAPCWGRPWVFLCRAGSFFSSRVPWHPTPLPWEGCGPPLGWRGPFSAQGPFSPLTFPLTAFLRRFHPDWEAVACSPRCGRQRWVQHCCPRTGAGPAARLPDRHAPARPAN